MSSLLKKLLVALVVAVLVWAGYTYFIKSAEAPLTASNDLVGDQASRDAQEFLSRLQQLQAINIEGRVFSDPRFRSLVNFRQTLVPESVGRTNPFDSVPGLKVEK